MISIGTRGSARAITVAMAIVLVAGCSGAQSPSPSAAAPSAAAPSAAAPSAAAPSAAAPSAASGKKPYIALSNAFIGNGWRQTMVNVFETAAKQAQADGLISGYEVDNAPGANSATAQIAQLQTIILKKPDAILINPASGTALDIVIQQACDAGIIVVVFDSGVTAPCAYKLHNNYSDWGHNSTLPALQAINNQGSVIVVRGVVGSLPETQFYDASKADLAAAPNVKVLATVIGYADDSKTQAAVLGVLGGLPKVDAVIGSVAGLGAARAFQAAGRSIPVVGFGTSGADLAYWKDNNVNNGSFSVLTDPGQSIAAMWEAIDIIAGKTVPKDVHTPLILIPQKDRDAWLKVLGPTQYAWWPWTHDLYEQQVQANANNSADVIPGVPTK